MLRTLRETDGVHNGDLLAAAFFAVLDSEESATAIRSMGYTTIDSSTKQQMIPKEMGHVEHRDR